MATFVRSGTNVNDASGTTLTVTLNGVAAGNLIVCWSKWEGATTTDTLDDGTSTFQNTTIINHSNGDLSGQVHYLLSANSGNRTYTQTLAAARPYRRLIVAEFSGTGTWSFSAQNGAFAFFGALNSGNVSPTLTDGVGWGGYGEYTANNITSPLINGVAATLIQSSAYSSAWYRTLTSGWTNGAATATNPGNGAWICPVAVFSVAAPTFIGDDEPLIYIPRMVA